jgi:hypothetical protein
LGAFIWVGMSFSVKNGLPTYQMVVSRIFKDYLDKFMKIFLDDLSMYSDMDIDTHLAKLILCFQNAKNMGLI